MNILVSRHDKLGDFVVSLPSIFVLKRHFPKVKIAVLVSTISASLAQDISFIDEVIIYKKANFSQNLSEIKAFKADIFIALFSNWAVARLAKAAKVPKRLAPATKIAQYLYTDRIKQRRSLGQFAEFEYNLQLLKAIDQNIKLDFPRPLLSFDHHEVIKIFQDFTQKYKLNKAKQPIALHPGSGGSSSCINLNIKEYLQLASLINNSQNYIPIFTFGPDELSLKQQVEKQLKKANLAVPCYVSDQGPLHFVKLLSQFRLFISVSTGAMHLAALINTATMTFFRDIQGISADRWHSFNDEQYNYILGNLKDFATIAKDLENFCKR